MIPEFGYYALVLALGLTSILAVLPLWGSLHEQLAWQRLARPLAYAVCAFISVAFLALAYAFLTNDFSVAYVVQNSNTQLPTIYKVCAIWGAHEGSMLLWVFVLGLWMAMVAKASDSLPLRTVAKVLAILGMVTAGFLSFILLTSNPFARLLPFAPSNGYDLNPILQDPGLVSHPPMLYMGYVGFSVAFAFAIAGLIEGRLDSAWLRWTRPWTLAAWSFLTIGITMGSWWSYHQLGWGGWWFWDPVENASFLPWLTGTALIHSLAVAQKRQAFKAWTVLLAIFAFSLSLMGTFLVRSGVLVSVHAFAVDPSRGVFMLGLMVLVVGGSLTLFACRMNKIRQVAVFSWLSREMALLLNNVLLVVMMATVLLGTLYPLLLQTLDIAKISVGAPYFNTVFLPLIMPLMLLMGFGPVCSWQQDDSRRLWRALALPLLLSVVLGLLLPWWLGGQFYWSVALGMSLVCWIGLSNSWLLLQSVKRQRLQLNQLGMHMAHLGLAVSACGIILSQAYGITREVTMTPGDKLNLGRYQLHFQTTQPLHGSNYDGLVGEFSLQKEGKLITQLHAEKRVFRVGHIAKTQPAIRPGFIDDIYLVLGDATKDNTWEVRAYYKPFVRWIWAGGFFMLLGGVLAMLARRYHGGRWLAPMEVG